MFCPKCGEAAAAGAQFCFKCGEPLPGSQAAAAVAEPVILRGITFEPGTGRYAGYYKGPSGWVTIDGDKVKPANPDREPPSTGRQIAGIICFAVALIAGWQGFSWLTAFADLEAGGNPFAGILVPLLLGAFVVAAGFAAAGFVLMSGKRRQ